jgi:hypothetical protein
MSSTTLQLYCEFKGWQGGTIHQALSDFAALPMSDKDKFCNKVFNFGLGNVTDLETFGNFTRMRVGL